MKPTLPTRQLQAPLVEWIEVLPGISDQVTDAPAVLECDGWMAGQVNRSLPGNEMNKTLVITPETQVLQQERTCRYGHGTLVHVDSVHGKPLFVAIAYGIFGELVDNPKFMGPLQWHVCKTCGYMETVDLSPNETLSVMGCPNG